MHEEITQSLKHHFAPVALQVTDESSQHNVPKGAQSHFRVLLVSAAFEGHSLLKRHRMVHAVLTGVYRRIHALALELYTPEEWQARGEEALESPPCHGGS